MTVKKREQWVSSAMKLNWPPRKWIVYYIAVSVLVYFALKSDRFSKSKFLETFCQEDEEISCSVGSFIAASFEANSANLITWGFALILGVFVLSIILNLFADTEGEDSEEP